jgi:hypothetical protein
MPEDVYSFLQCEPWRQTAINGFFNRLFKGKAIKDAGNRPAEKKRSRKRKRLLSLGGCLKGKSDLFC